MCAAVSGANEAPDAVIERARRLEAAGEVAAAYQALTEALMRAELEGTTEGLGSLHVQLARLARQFGDCASARQHLEHAATIDGLPQRVQADVAFELALVDILIDFLGDAKSHLRVAEKAYRELGDDRGVARCHLEFADLHASDGDTTIARLDLRAAASLVASPADASEYHLVAARVAAVAGDLTGAAKSLDAAVESARSVAPGRLAVLEAIRRAWLEDRTKSPGRHAGRAGDPGAAVRFVSIVVGRDGMLGEAAVLDSSAFDDANLRACSRFIAGVTDRRDGMPVSSEPPIALRYFIDRDVFGIAYCCYMRSGTPVAVSIIATGADQDDHRVLASEDGFVSLIAGRWLTDSYVGFARHHALRPGALSAVTERPVAFFVPMVAANECDLRAAHDRHCELAAVFIAMVERDDETAGRIRRHLAER